MITPINVFKKCSPEGQKKIKLIEEKLYDIDCEKIIIDMQLKELDKMVEKEFWS
jgi:hypothetical protein